MQRGFFLTFEGLDGCGKSTQSRLLADALESRGMAVVRTRQPGGTAFGERLRELLLDSKTTGIDGLTELALMFADRAQSIHEVIAPALAAGSVVVCDRFTDSTEAYQGGGRELGSEPILALHEALCGGLQPDMTFLLRPAFGASLKRARRRNERVHAVRGVDENRFEREETAFFERVDAKYGEIAAREPQRVVTIGEGTIEEIHAKILEMAEARIAAVVGR
jgi:dTMP kinase